MHLCARSLSSDWWTVGGPDDEWRDSRRQIFLGPLLCAIREQRCNELRNPAEHQRLTCKVNETRCNFDFALPETSFPFRTRNRLNGRLFGESIGLPNTLDRLFQMSRCQTIKREKSCFIWSPSSKRRLFLPSGGPYIHDNTSNNQS